MSNDHGHHDPGGHELEAINTKLLFRLMISLSIVTLLASMAVVQWFYSQRNELQLRNAAEGSFALKQYKEQMGKDLEGIDVVRRQILADGKVLLAPPPPAGWVHPDDLLSGGGAPAVDPAAPAAVEPGPPIGPAGIDPAANPAIVVEGAPGIPVPAGAPDQGRAEGAGTPPGPDTKAKDEPSAIEKPADERDEAKP